MMAIYDTMQFVRPRRVARSASARPRRPRPCCWRPARPASGSCCRTRGSLLHQPSGGGQGTISDLALQAKEILRLRAEMEEVLARHTGQDVERLRADTDRDQIFTAQQAVEYGLADGVVRPLAG